MSGSCRGVMHPDPIPSPLTAALAKAGRAVPSAAPPPRGVNSITFLPLRARTAGEEGFEVSARAIFPSHPLLLPGEPSFQIIQPLPRELPGRGVPTISLHEH